MPKKNKYRSNFERNIAADLRKRKRKFKYETLKIEYIKPVYSGVCSSCGSTDVGKKCTYTPDFIFKNFIVEAKGRFTPSDRKKMLLVCQQHPEYDIRMLFMQDRYISKKKGMRYTDWCAINNIKCAVGTEVPEEWFEEF